MAICEWGPHTVFLSSFFGVAKGYCSLHHSGEYSVWSSLDQEQVYFSLTNNRHNSNKRKLLNNAATLPPLLALFCAVCAAIVILRLAVGPAHCSEGEGGQVEPKGSQISLAWRSGILWYSLHAPFTWNPPTAWQVWLRHTWSGFSYWYITWNLARDCLMSPQGMGRERSVSSQFMGF